MVAFFVNVITEDNNNDDYYYKPTINESKWNQKWVMNKQGMRKKTFLICLAKLPMKKEKRRQIILSIKW